MRCGKLALPSALRLGWSIRPVDAFRNWNMLRFCKHFETSWNIINIEHIYTYIHIYENISTLDYLYTAFEKKKLIAPFGIRHAIAIDNRHAWKPQAGHLLFLYVPLNNGTPLLSVHHLKSTKLSNLCYRQKFVGFSRFLDALGMKSAFWRSEAATVACASLASTIRDGCVSLPWKCCAFQHEPNAEDAEDAEDAQGKTCKRVITYER